MLIVPDMPIRRICAVGSQVTCDPPPPIKDSDYDYLCLVWSLKKSHDKLSRQGWHCKVARDSSYTGSQPYFNVSFSARFDNHNLIVTNRRWFYNRFVKATTLATKLNLQDKQQRVDLFQYILYDNL